jgi:hypothetical protein
MSTDFGRERRGKYHLEDPGVDGMIILILKLKTGMGMCEFDSPGSG